MKQQTFAAGDCGRYRELTHRQQLPAWMDKVVPWGQLCALIKAPVLLMRISP